MTVVSRAFDNWPDPLGIALVGSPRMSLTTQSHGSLYLPHQSDESLVPRSGT